MTPIFRSLIAIAVTALLWLGPSACKPKTPGNSILTTTVAGREIRAIIDGNAFIQPGSDSATVSFPGHKVTVEKGRVLLDDVELAKLPTSATKVEVTVSAGQLTVTADGTAVTSKPLSK